MKRLRAAYEQLKGSPGVTALELAAFSVQVNKAVAELEDLEAAVLGAEARFLGMTVSPTPSPTPPAA